MKFLHTIIFTGVVTLFAVPALAQRDINTASARAAYSALRTDSETTVKKNKHKKEKRKKPRKSRKIKTKDLQLARERRSSLHF